MMVRYVIKGKAENMTESDISRMLPPHIGDGYTEANIIWQNQCMMSQTMIHKKHVMDALRKRGCPATLKSTMYTYTGKPALIVELGDGSSEIKGEK